jgi:hypothetical protein
MDFQKTKYFNANLPVGFVKFTYDPFRVVSMIIRLFYKHTTPSGLLDNRSFQIRSTPSIHKLLKNPEGIPCL